MNKKIIAVTLFISVLVLLLCACGNAAKLTEYDFGTDKVPSVNAVIGEERKVTGVDVGTSNGVQYKQYTYESTSMVDDLADYTLYLRDNGWIVTKDYNFADGKGEAQLAAESADSGKILVISIAFEEDKYAIRVNKLEGELTLN